MDKHVHLHIHKARTRDALPFPSEAEVDAAIDKLDFDKLKRWVRLTPKTPKERELYEMIQEKWQER